MHSDSAEKPSDQLGVTGTDTQRQQLDIQLDSGNEHVKYRRRFWQLWYVSFCR